MSGDTTPPAGAYRHEFTVALEAIDVQGHVNNVAYVQWMQDVAIRHSAECGGTAAAAAAGGTWVVRSHKVEYIAPAYAGEQILAVTWVENIQRVRSLRQYRFIRAGDDRLLARGQTDWVFVSVDGHRPCPIPDSVRACFAGPAG